MTLDQLKAEEKRLSAEILAVQKRIHDLQCEAAGVKVGDVVEYKGVQHRVTTVDTHWGFGNKPWVKGNPKRKDGSWGERVVHMYTYWTKPV
jgi:hypothetical protein